MNQKAHTIKRFFSRETSVGIIINASPDKIWNILIDVNNYKNWNSTILSIEGEIKIGGQITLIPAISPKQKFKLKTKLYEPFNKIVLGDMMGTRTYSLQKTNNTDETLFIMTEKIGGPLFPFFANLIPSFDESFDKYTMDLKTEAEK